MITLNKEEQEIDQERKRIIRQIENRPTGYMGTQLAINEKGKIVTLSVIHRIGKKGHRF